MKGLTERQKKVLEFIESYIEEHGYPPSIREIARRFRITPRGAQLHLLALEKKGYIIRTDGKARAMRIVGRVEGVELPIVGRIAAGEALEIFGEVYETIEVPKSMVKPGFEHYVLKVVGESMIGDHIKDGDLIVVRKQDFANSGDIVAVVIDSSRATLKRIYYRGKLVELRPSNPEMEPILIESDRVRITGKVVGLIRMY